MILLSFLVKACAVSIVTGTAIVTPVLYVSSRDNDTIDLSKADLSDLSVQGASSRGECWEIPITPKESLKFLVCANKDKYYLYGSSASDDSKAFTKITKIEGPKNKTITITLEGASETKTLTLSNEKWKTSPEKLDFFQHCNKVSTDKGSALFCSTSSLGSWSESIELTKFRVNK